MVEQYKKLCHIIYKTSKNELITLNLESMNFKLLIELSVLHNVYNIFYYAIINNNWQNYIEKELLSSLKQKLLSSYTLNVEQQIIIKEMIKVAEENKKSIILFKGSINKELYYKPEMRIMSDIDFIPKDIDFFMKYLDSKKFKCFASSELENAYVKGNMVIELHFGLDPQGKLKNYNNYLIKYKDYNNVFILSNEFYFVYLLDHALKHFKHGGFGVKILIDFILFTEQNKIDNNILVSLLKEYKLYNFMILVNEIIFIFFGIKIINNDNLIYSKDEINAIVEMFINGGEYGKKNDVLSLCYASGQYSYWKFIFMPRRDLYRRIPICGKHKILLPIGYLLNFFGETLRIFGLFKPRDLDKNLIKKYRKIFHKISKT